MLSTPGGFVAAAKERCRCCNFEFEVDDEEEPAVAAAAAQNGGPEASSNRNVPPPAGGRRRPRSSAALERLPSDAEIAAALEGASRFDSHAHVHHLGGGLASATTTSATTPPFAVVAQACEEEEWAKVVEFCSKSPRFVAGLGVHPWRAHAVTDEAAMAKRLEEALRLHPRAIVGEIGLCKCAKNVRGKKDERDAGFLKQVAVFEAQLAVAAELGRPVSVHAVKANAALKKAISNVTTVPGKKTQRVALHSFSGTADLVRALLKDYAPLGVELYFGFSHTVNVEMNKHNNTQKRRDALYDAIAAVPDDRILVESDVDDLESARLATDRAVALVAAVKGWSLADTAKRTSKNALAWLNLRPPPAAAERTSAADYSGPVVVRGDYSVPRADYSVPRRVSSSSSGGLPPPESPAAAAAAAESPPGSYGSYGSPGYGYGYGRPPHNATRKHYHRRGPSSSPQTTTTPISSSSTSSLSSKRTAQTSSPSSSSSWSKDDAARDDATPPATATPTDTK